MKARQGNPDALRRVLNHLWGDLQGSQVSVAQFQQDLDTCMALLPEEDSSDYTALYCAEDAVSAIAYAVSTRLDADPQQAAWAASRAYDALDTYVQGLLRIKSFTPTNEERVLAHPLVQAELRRQSNDLSQLERLAEHPAEEKQGIADLHLRAQLDANVFFGAG
jgi:uncharacterized protein YjaG (DUF416 family)